MNNLKFLWSTVILCMVFTMSSCAQEKHNEEDGTQFSKSQTYKENKKGVLLTLKYNASSDAFEGVIENTSNKTAEKARVEVHLSNGVELGPTKPKNLKPGEKTTVNLSANGNEFKTWSTHAEIGSNEHGHEGGEGHEGREKGEHNKKEKREGKGEHGGKKEKSGEHN